MLYPIDFDVQKGGKKVKPDELTPVSDLGEQMQPTHRRIEK
ncbi:hypothetical protein [Yersinia alsatica]|nr:hypothetical protein [Yersinia alsatica]